MARDHPRLLAALDVAASAVAKVKLSVWPLTVICVVVHYGFCAFTLLIIQEEHGLEDYETLDMYQQSLGELLLALAGKNLTLCNRKWTEPKLHPCMVTVAI